MMNPLSAIPRFTLRGMFSEIKYQHEESQNLLSKSYLIFQKFEMKVLDLHII